MKVFKTNGGTELPITNIKGKDYLEAKYRVVWFREERPEWGIETEIISHDADNSLCRATIRNEQGRIMAQASKEETRSGFPDHLEKAETSAIARALALVGFGTQFASEFEEGERLADSPVEAAKVGPRAVSGDPGAYVIKFGQKYIGKALQEIGPHDCHNYAEWLKKQAESKGQPLTGVALEAVNAIEAFCKSREPKAK